jgi:RNA polymerase sigma factor (sigma-70 family)
MTDRDLLLAYAESCDGDSLGAYVKRYQDSLTRFAARFLGDPETAQDVVQETFLQVARHPRKLLDVENHHNWLLRVVRNIGISLIRKRQRARKREEVVGRRLAADGAAREDAGVLAVEEEEVRMRVHAEIGRLSPRHREVLLLKVQEEKTYREIAEITGMSVTNVGFILHQAVKELSRRLGAGAREATS